MRNLFRLATIAFALSGSVSAHAQIVRSAAGANAAAISPARSQFQLDLGGGVVAGPEGSFADATGARREINWDSVPEGLASFNNLPLNYFNSVSPRGVMISTPGSSVQVSAGAGFGVVEFGNVDPSYSGTFEAFSAERLFTPVGSNIVDLSFFVPGTATPALVKGFGSIFTDVDLTNTTSIQFFNAANISIGTFFVPNVAGGSETFSFLGVSYATPIISRVRITNGNIALNPGVLDNNGNPNDLVMMDDILYGEPLAPIPEPATWALMIAGFALAGYRIRSRTQAIA